MDSKNKDGQGSEIGAQDRLEKVWTMLGLPDAKKLDMAIKYSSDRYHSMLHDVSLLSDSFT